MPDPASLAGDIDLSRFFLDGTKLRAEITDAVTGGEVESTIEGASTLTLVVSDPDRKLYETGLYQDRARLVALDRAWEFVKVEKQGDDFTVTFEDEIVAALRRQRQPKTVRRGTMNRAQFIRSRVLVVKRPRIVFGSPEIPKPRPMRPQRITLPPGFREVGKGGGSKAAADEERQPGLPDNANLKVKGRRADRVQLRNMEIVLDTATRILRERNVTDPRVLQSVVVAPIAENAYRNTQGAGADSVSWGIFQAYVGLSNSHRGTINRRMALDIAFCTEAFLVPPGFTSKGGAIKIARRNPRKSAGWIAAEVEGPLARYRHRYDLYLHEAKAIIAAYGGDTGSNDSGASGTSGRYQFSQGRPGGPKGEDAWAMSGRLAEEVGRRRFVVGDRFYYISEATLMKSRARVILSEDHPGVDVIDFNVDLGAKVDTASVTCRSPLWQTPPGAVVLLSGMGKQADGRWLVSTVRRGVFDQTTSIELRRGRALLAEKREPPAAIGRTEPADRTTAGDVAVSDIRQRIAAIANKEVGFHEGPGNRNPYGPDDAWCAYFASWVWRKAGVRWETTGWAGTHPPSPFKRGQRPGNPKVGDAVNYSGHVGIVTALTGGDPYVSVEGNYQNAVTRRKRHSGVTGFKSPPGV